MIARMKRGRQELSLKLAAAVSVFRGEKRVVCLVVKVKRPVLAGFGPRLVQRNSNRVKISKAKPRRGEGGWWSLLIFNIPLITSVSIPAPV